MKTVQRFIREVLPAWLPAQVLFLLIPSAIYLSNQNEFNYDLLLVFGFGILAASSLLCLVALLWVPSRWRRTIVPILFYFGVFLALSDLIAPLQMGELQGALGHGSLRASTWQIAAEAALAAAVIICALRLPFSKVASFASALVLALLAVQVIVIVSALSPRSSLEPRATIRTVPEPRPRAVTGNVYQIVFDTYSSLSFLDDLARSLIREQFDGFTFFENSRANYIRTFASVAGFMTGTFYEGGSMEQWVRHSRNEGGILSHVHDAGYTVSMYLPKVKWAHRKASNVTIAEIGNRHLRWIKACHFADLCILRSVPAFLRGHVYEEGSGLISTLFSRSDLRGEKVFSFESVGLMRKLIADERSRPDQGQYVYAHLALPHGPDVVRPDCTFAGATDYHRQARCAVKLMAELIAELERLGRYEKSLIIFHSDHGKEGVGPEEYGLTPDVERAITSAVGTIPVNLVIDRTFALLMVKPPFSSTHPLIVSKASSQLADIPATVGHYLGTDMNVKVGRPLLSIGDSEDRRVDIFLGLQRRDQAGRDERVGKRIFEGELCHLSHSHKTGWKILPTFPFSWDGAP